MIQGIIGGGYLMLKTPVKFDISTYKLIQMSDIFKKKRGPYQLQKSRIMGTIDRMGYFVWDVTHYDDNKLIGTRVITHYYTAGRSVMFA